MKHNTFYKYSLISTISLAVTYPSYGSDHGKNPSSQPKQDITTEALKQQAGEPVQDVSTEALKQQLDGKSVQDIITQVLEKQADQGDEDIKDIQERTRKRSEARHLQEKGEKFEKKVEGVTSPLEHVGITAALVASAGGSYQGKKVAAAFELAVLAIEGLGKGFAKIIIGVGRYRERSQEIFSGIELLVEDAQKSLEKITDLKKKQQELLDADKDADTKAPESSQSSSRLKQFGQKLSNAPANIQNKIRQATEYVTNEKAKRGEKLQAIQADLKKENENYEEIIKLFQIKLLQDAVNEIDRKKNVKNIEGTIDILKRDKGAYELAKQNISAGKSKAKKEVVDKESADIEEKYKGTLKSLEYFENFKQSFTDADAKKLEEERAKLIEKIEQLKRSTKRGAIVSLEEKGRDAGNPQVDRSTIAALYKEIDGIKERLEKLENGEEAPKTGAINKQPNDARKTLAGIMKNSSN